jgi:methyl-accepting chemotaxis protein
MSQVDSVTERSATAAEQLASTAEEMTVQAHALRDLVSSVHKNALTTTSSIRLAAARAAANGSAPVSSAAAQASSDSEFRPF